MKQITLYVYQTIDGCTARPDKEVENAIGKADLLLLDEETYLTVFMNHLGCRSRTKILLSWRKPIVT